jgi:hypothetical protein
MADIYWNYDDANFIVVACSECGPFTAVVYKHNDDYTILEDESSDHLIKVHGAVA